MWQYGSFKGLSGLANCFFCPQVVDGKGIQIKVDSSFREKINYGGIVEIKVYHYRFFASLHKTNSYFKKYQPGFVHSANW
jgi:hypothetical protein